MKAAVLRAPRRMELEELPVPEPGSGWVRLANRASGICGSDMHIYTGNHPWLAAGSPMAKYVLGHVYGHEIAGVVDAVGEGVTEVSVGDRVALDAIVPCLKCAYCRIGLYQICTDLSHFGFHHPGGFAEYTLAPAKNLWRIPESVDFEEAALLDVLVVGVHAVHVARVSLADRVAVLGAGPIGIAIAAAARRAGAREIFITAKHEIQRKIAASLAVENVIDALDGSITNAVLGRTGGLGVDCVIESIGYKSKTIELALKLVRKGGRIVFTGVFEEPVTLNFGDLLIKEASISASHAFGMWGLVPEFELALELLIRGDFPARQIITNRYPLEQIGEAFEQKLSNPSNTMKVEIVFPKVKQ
jgi:(R,R)-butanediol dehydrogenase/meso-butanediol dehydrogenase/diacetyl reductase